MKPCPDVQYTNSHASWVCHLVFKISGCFPVKIIIFITHPTTWLLYPLIGFVPPAHGNKPDQHIRRRRFPCAILLYIICGAFSTNSQSFHYHDKFYHILDCKSTTFHIFYCRKNLVIPVKIVLTYIRGNPFHPFRHSPFILVSALVKLCLRKEKTFSPENILFFRENDKRRELQ